MPPLISNWSVVTPVIVIGTTPVATLARLSRTPLTVVGVKVSGTPSSEPVSLVA